MDAGPSEGWAGWTAAGVLASAVCEEEKTGEYRWQRPGCGWIGGDSGAGMPVCRPVYGWIIAKYVGYASYTRLPNSSIIW